MADVGGSLRISAVGSAVGIGSDLDMGVGADSGAVMTAPAPERTGSTGTVVAPDVPWVTIVWNDPVNLMSYVTLVFQKLLGHPRPKAEALMLDVHHKGRATVSSGPREKMEADVAKLQAAGLWATMARDS
jgi:ATP-dependent Clp protease adaptor protein ClpS